MRTQLAAVDARLDAAAQQVIAASATLAHDAAGAAAVVARDPGLAQALPGSPGEPTRGRRARGAPVPAADPAAEETSSERAARSALGAAERALGFRLPDGTTVVAATRETLAALEGALGDAAPLLRAAVDGASPRGHVLVDGKLLYAAAAPAGEGHGVLVLAPVGESFARGVAAASGVPVLLVVPEAKPIVAGSLSPGRRARDREGRADLRCEVGRRPARPGGFERRGDAPEGATARRRCARVPRPLRGARGGEGRVRDRRGGDRSPPRADCRAAVAGRRRASPSRWCSPCCSASSCAPPSRAPMLPEPLLSAATRIEKGDFAARVPDLAGQLGTVAAALNRATRRGARR